MSYILDALKKAQAENDPDVRTSLATELLEKRRYRNLLLLIGLALLGNALVLVYIFVPGPWQQNSAENPLLSSTRSEPEPAAALPAATPDPDAGASAPAPGVSDRTPQSQDNGATTAAQTSRPAAASAPVVAAAAKPIRATLGTLPADVRSRFPGLTFSTHVYASDPGLRAVVVNGKRLVEGDRLNRLQLKEITETGVVFGFENYLVSVPVLEDWD